MRKIILLVGLVFLLGISGVVGVRITSEANCVEGESSFNFELDGDNSIDVGATLKGGNTVSFNVLYGDETESLGTGRDSESRLAVSNLDLTFIERDSNGNGYHRYFIVTYTPTSESYLLRAQITQDLGWGKNETIIQSFENGNWITICDDKVMGSYCYWGNVELIVGKISYTAGGEESVVLSTPGNNAVFNKVCDINGNCFFLPLEDYFPRTYITFDIYNSGGSIIESWDVVSFLNNIMQIDSGCSQGKEIGVTKCILLEPEAGREDVCNKWDYQNIFSCQGVETETDPCSTDISNKYNLNLCYEWFIDAQMTEHYNFCGGGCENTECLYCTESWSCTSWSNCSNNQQTRTCIDSNSCGTTENKPSTSQSCTLGACTENWDCVDWSSCANSLQTRTCTDSNSCGTILNKPSLSEICSINREEVLNEDAQDSLEKIPDKETFSLNGKDVTVSRNENGELSIDFGEGGIVDIEGSLDLIKDKLGAYIMTSMGKQKIEITAKDAIVKATKIDELEKVEIEEYKTIAVYSVYGTKETKLFFIIPKKAKVMQRVNVENGRLMSTELPWWRFLAIGI